MAGKLEGKVAVVTGGVSGIGRATAELFAAEGADLVLGDFNEALGDEAVAAVEAAGRRARFVRVDASAEADCEALADAAVETFGRLDVLVAAAGISNWRANTPPPPSDTPPDPTASYLVNAPVEAWEKVLDVNLTGVMLSDRAAARRMIALGNGGSIINLASIMAKLPRPGVAPYCVSKAAVWMLTKVLALELAPHQIRVNAIGPGFIETPMTAPMQTSDLARKWAMDLTPMNRMGRPEEVAKTALFLAGEDSSFYTGTILHPDGGVFTD